jgi:hypothetical protein
MATGILNIRRNKAGKMLIKSANEVIGGLSAPSKMPGAAFSLSILVCHIGSLLRKVVGSTCYKCYAARGNYARATVKRAVKRRLFKLRKAIKHAAYRALYIEAFVELLRNEEEMRWHDSGDIISVEHLELIAEIARQTPWCDHWLPTKELGRVIKWLDQGHKLPDNLCIRVSGYMIDEIPKGLPKGINSASVHSDRDRGKKNDCPAVRFHTTCDGANCRKCWDRKVKNVSYGMHGANATVGDSDAARSLWEKELQAGGVAV